MLSEDHLQPTHTTSGQGFPRCYTHWGWCDVDGIIGRHLATVLDQSPQPQRQGIGPGLGLAPGQGLGPGQGLTQRPGLAIAAPPVNVCSINTTIHTFYAQGMWQSPIFSGQLSVLCNNHQSRYYYCTMMYNESRSAPIVSFFFPNLSYRTHVLRYLFVPCIHQYLPNLTSNPQSPPPISFISSSLHFNHFVLFVSRYLSPLGIYGNHWVDGRNTSMPRCVDSPLVACLFVCLLTD